MAEVIIKIDIPIELKSEFELALSKVVKQFIRRLEFSMIKDIMSKSQLTEEQADKLANELKERVAKRHGL